MVIIILLQASGIAANTYGHVQSTRSLIASSEGINMTLPQADSNIGAKPRQILTSDDQASNMSATMVTGDCCISLCDGSNRCDFPYSEGSNACGRSNAVDPKSYNMSSRVPFWKSDLDWDSKMICRPRNKEQA